jgi:putative oxidoreductase
MTMSTMTSPRPAIPAFSGIYSSLEPYTLPLLRLVMGLILFPHGGQKLFGWFGGGGITGTTAFFTSVGLPAPHAFAYVAGILEFFGGIAIALGLLTVAATAGLIAEMVIAVAAVSYSAGFFVTAQKIGWELNAYLIGLLAALLLTGPGRWSADAALGLTRRRVPARASVPSRQDAPI